LRTYICDKIETNEMGGACSTYGGDERCIQGFWWGNLKEDKSIDEMIR
jgi:hypothetical protein